MYLSKLELIGFKSFAHRTVLRFNDGITAIVGPNGCGKSNLIDALRWAIGEQKASVLRSDRMENVIFNGAGKRRPLGMAEVSLTVENTKGILPTEYSEVTIARRLFRNGDSEYLLNKTQCRLRDIVDLFMDTGMGANAYSVIELKMIETILSDRADERRRLFEEAAGVTKYKHRRREALRRLEQTQGDLTRINDIVKEVGKKVGSLERQAVRAKEYKELDAERLRLDIDVLEREYASTMSRIEPLRAKLAEARAKKDELDAHLAEEETVIQELEREHSEIDAELLEAQKDVTAVSGRIAQLERERAVAQERRRSLLTASDRAERDIAEARGGLEALARDRNDVEAALTTIREQLVEAEGTQHVMKGEVEEVKERVTDVRRRARGAQDRVIAVINALGELRGEEERIRARMDSIRGRLEGFDEEDESARIDRETAEERLGQTERELAEAIDRLERAQEAFRDGELAKTRLATEIDQLKAEGDSHRAAINSRETKIEFLAGLVDQDESMRYLVDNRDWCAVDPIPVADVISVDEKFRAAVTAAIGQAAGYLIVPTIDDARRGIARIEEGGKGRATFVCLDRLPKTTPGSPIAETPGLGWASDVTASSPEYDAVRRLLLHDVLIVSTVEEATQAVDMGVPRAVTLDGVVVAGRASVSGGSASSGAVIGKHEIIARLREEMAEHVGALQRIDARISELRSEMGRVDLGALSNAVREAQGHVGSVERNRSRFEYEIQSADDLVAAHESDRVHFTEEITKLEEAQAGIEPRRLALRQEQEEGEKLVRDVAFELEREERELAERSRLLNECEVSMASLRGDERSGRTELDRIRRDREKAEKMIENRRVEKEEWTTELEQVDDLLSESAVTVESFRDELITAQRKLDDIVGRQTAKREEIARHSERLREERKGYESTLGMAHELEMKINEMTTRTDAMVERARDEFELTLHHRESVDDEVSLTTLREDLRNVKGRLKLLGTVNFLAYEEWEEENTRYLFLKGQVEDLRNAEKTLIDTISEINDTAQTKFIETFDSIRKNFQDIFSTLFLEGDEADIKLSEGDPLEAQIEIIAKPRGKRPHSIDLLSGGEKTLTAIALLFSIYLVKPSPFCILDEVDAPLDDANIDRFIQLVRRFVRETQFIIVTHNKRTMAAADTMYGVTQEEDGVSKIVSVRFTESAAAKNGARVVRTEAPAEVQA